MGRASLFTWYTLLTVLVLPAGSVEGGAVGIALGSRESEGAHVISEVAPSEGVSWWNQSHTLPRELSRSQIQEAKSGKSDRNTTSDYYRGFEAGLRSCSGGRVTRDKLPSVVRREGLALGGGSIFLVIVAALCAYRCRQGSRSQVA